MSRVKVLQAKVKKEAAVWARLDILPGDLLKHPAITPILINSLGSIEHVINYLRGSDSKEAKELLRIWDEGTHYEHSVLPIEAYCLAAHTSPKVMMGIIMQAVVEESDIATELLLATSKREVVQKTIKLAKTTKGGEERRIVLQNRGVMAAPKNQVFNNFGSMTQDNRKQVANVSLNQLEEDNDRISEAVDKFNLDRVSKVAGAKVDIIDIIAEED